MTLAPEATSLDMIERLAKAGVVISAGHTNAPYALVRAAMDQGLTGFTHLFNAMSPLGSREPGVVGAALEDQDAWCGIIVDGVHVDPVSLKLALKLRPHERFMLVTDAMPCVGSDQTAFNLQGKTIVLRDGACFDETGTLAGSALDMASAVRNAVAMLGLDLADASGWPAAIRPDSSAWRTRWVDRPRLLRRPGVAAGRRSAGAGHLDSWPRRPRGRRRAARCGRAQHAQGPHARPGDGADRRRRAPNRRTSRWA